MRRPAPRGSHEAGGGLGQDRAAHGVDSSGLARAPQTRPTMRDVARAAGVSLKTVSRVVNQEAGVKAETLARVTAAIDTLGFRRNDLARSLRPGQTSSTLGLMIGDVGNPFFAGIARGVESVARVHGYMVVAGSSDEDADHERELVAALCARRVDGMLLVPAGSDQSYLKPELAMGTQVVFVDRPPGGIEADAVVLDNVGGARRAVEHLLRHGHRRIGLVADDPTIYTARQRIRGYREALAAAGLPTNDAPMAFGGHAIADGARSTRTLLERADPPTALFAINNRMSVGALRVLRAHPTPVGLVGFDDLELAEMLPTPLTVISHDPQAMGRAAAERLFSRVHGDASPPRTIVMPTPLVRRGSGEVTA